MGCGVAAGVDICCPVGAGDEGHGAARDFHLCGEMSPLSTSIGMQKRHEF